jgi:hypothetical protein
MKQTKILGSQVREGDMKSTLALLVAVVLMVFSFTLNSCKKCSKDTDGGWQYR